MKWSAQLDARAAGILLGVAVMILGVTVLSRSFGWFSFVWVIEITEFLFPWIVFLGAAAAFREGREIVVDSLFTPLPERLRTVVLAVSYVITAVCAGYLTIVAVQLAMQMAPQHTPLLGISLGWRALALACGMALITVHVVLRLIALGHDPSVALLAVSRANPEE
jgi:TRAP-type C4-dicarboxylate transport system permease small subunit